MTAEGKTTSARIMACVKVELNLCLLIVLKYEFSFAVNQITYNTCQEVE